MESYADFTEGDEWGSDANPGAVERLQGEFAREDLARHLAFFYRAPETQLRVAAAFVDHALRTNRRVLYFLDGNTREDVESMLRSLGVDVAARIEAGDLVIEHGAEVYQQADFDPQRLISELEAASDESTDDGYDGLWLAGETSWCFHTDDAYDHIVDFEAEFDAACPDLPIVALCQYDLNRFNEESVAKALWTHEQIVYRYSVCVNPFYISPEAYRSSATRPLNTQLMLEQIHNLAETKRDVERHEQRLAVVNRILRHNIRNEINIAQGLARLVADTASLERDHQERLETAITHLDDVFDIADKARYVERTLDESPLGRATVSDVLEDARERVAQAYPDAEIAVRCPDDVPVVADANLATAFVELFLYTFRVQPHEPPELSVAVAAQPSGVRVDVQYPGPPVPEIDRLTLEAGTETPLRHCEGLGLWLATWIVENSRGRLTFPSDSESQFRVELREAPPGSGV